MTDKQKLEENQEVTGKIYYYKAIDGRTHNNRCEIVVPNHLTKEQQEVFLWEKKIQLKLEDRCWKLVESCDYPTYKNEVKYD